ncbi:cytochrome c biogenesis protein CcmG, thiol:disulfide interchange protein DsbE [Solimonas aquatica]|uniref:Cytochrome c biogenesis protein CcmG, thiol:disulfide interchange protein DsbE n=1 Tax=Solimonas aquatica TaxID=489703 RepID=A0A1H9HFH6_9GAMM|nr:DsbE family thiol:disulfide interchange protein [Solimonas aquatica]SEQ60966.1 cytochrome c biogenesis protein CcmG, thiol:disulfide interchange protein DsbE [Solimonas aquatica]
MRLRYLVPVALLLGLLVLLGIGLRHDPREVPSPLIGKPAPALSLAVLGREGSLLKTEDLKGRPVLVNYFASWCAACVDEHPFLMQLAAKGVEIIGVDYKDTPEDVQAWLARHGNPYRTVISDPQGSAGLDWGVYGAPETFVLDAQGTIVYKQIGAMNERVWEDRIAQHFGSRP